MATTLGNVSDIFGLGEGYAPGFGTSATFSPELAPAGTTLVFATSGGGLGWSGLYWSISGNRTADFAGLTHIKIGGTDYAVTSGPTYDSGNDSTDILFSTVPRFTVGNNYEVDTVGLGGGDTTAPTITSASSVNNVEGTTLAHALTADESVTWSIVGGADQADFEISGSTLRWVSNGTQDYDSPADADTNNVYVVTVRATDGASNTTDQTISVTVTQAYAGPTYVGKSTASGSTAATSIDFTSSGRTSGDKLLVAIATANQAITAPSGFTEVSSSPQSRGTAGAAGGIRLAVFEKDSDGTETTVSIADSGNHQYAVGIVLRKSGDDVLEVTASAGNNVAAGTSCTFGGVTTTGDDQMVVTFVGTDRDNAGPSFSSEANASLGNLTERHDAGTTQGAGSGIAVYTGEKQAAGASGNTTATQAASAAYCWITLSFANAVAVSEATGTLAATESGTDTSSVAGIVPVAGIVAATESGSDAAALSGVVPIIGALAATESGADVAAISGTVADPAITGTLAASEVGGDTSSIAGTVPVSGTLSATESGGDAADFLGVVPVIGALASAEVGADAASASGTVAVAGALAASEAGDDTASISGGLAISGALAALESGSDDAALSGAVTVSGIIAAQESGGDSADLAGVVPVSGAIAATESGSDTAAISGTGEYPPVTGTMAAMESGADTASIAGTVGVAGALDATEGGTDTASFNGLIVIEGGLSASEAGQDSASIAGTVDITGTLAANDNGGDTAAIFGRAGEVSTPANRKTFSVIQYRNSASLAQGRSSQSVMQDRSSRSA